jgi:Skp family chaperone for outer membrane proteins
MAILERIPGRPSMSHKRVILLAAIFILPAAAGAQHENIPPPPTAVVVPTKIGIINIQNVIVGTDDGQKELQALEKKFEPRKAELKALSDEIEALKKQLDTQGPKLNDEARAALVKQIDSKQKSFGRVEEEAQSDFGTQQNEIIQKILQKLIPVIDKYAKDNGLIFIMDGSKPWPEWPLVWASPSVDISKAVVDIYNASLGPPAASSTPRPSGTNRPNPETKPKRP